MVNWPYLAYVDPTVVGSHEPYEKPLAFRFAKPVQCAVLIAILKMFDFGIHKMMGDLRVMERKPLSVTAATFF